MGGGEGCAPAVIEKQRDIARGQPRAAAEIEPCLQLGDAEILVPAELDEGMRLIEAQIGILIAQRLGARRDRIAELRRQ